MFCIVTKKIVTPFCLLERVEMEEKIAVFDAEAVDVAKSTGRWQLLLVLAPNDYRARSPCTLSTFHTAWE